MKTRCWMMTAGLLLLAATVFAQGRVQSVSGTQLTLSVGVRDGVVVGQTGSVKQIRGVGHRVVTAEVATFRVTEVQEQSSTAEVTKLEPGARIGVGNPVALDPPAPPPDADAEPEPMPDERSAEPAPSTRSPQPSSRPAPTPRPKPARSAGATAAQEPKPPEVHPAPAEAPKPKEARPEELIRVGGNIKPPKRTKTVPPVYPDAARQARVQGVVILECTISAEGKVKKIVVLRSIPPLDEAAADAVEQWEYEPTLLNGVAVPVIMTVTVNFSLS